MFFEDLFGGGGFGGGGGMPRGPKKPVDNSKYYDILGVPKTASTAEISKAYKTLARTCHPDKGGDPEKFKEIVKAYETLGDPQKREKYDEYGEDAEQMGDGSMGGMFRERRPAKGDNITYPMSVTLEELFKGTTKRLKVNRDVLCASCKGSGGKNKTRCTGCNGRGVSVQLRQIGPGMIQQVQSKCSKCEGKGSVIPRADRCAGCDGAGLLKEAKMLEAVVEKGMSNQDRIVFSGEGEQEPDAEPGDVVVVLRALPHPRFQRQGAHLFMKKHLTLADALTGFELRIPHLDDRVLIVKQPPGKVTKPGQLRVIRNEGMPHRHNPFRRGHLYIEFDVDFPDSLEQKQIELLKAVFGKQEKASALPPEPMSAPAGGASGSKKKKNKKKNAAAAAAAAPESKARSDSESKSASTTNGKEEDYEELELDDVDVEIEKKLWRQEKEEEAERRAAEDEESDQPRVAQCATH